MKAGRANDTLQPYAPCLSSTRSRSCVSTVAVYGKRRLRPDALRTRLVGHGATTSADQIESSRVKSSPDGAARDATLREVATVALSAVPMAARISHDELVQLLDRQRASLDFARLDVT
jgi:hypothetical protein